jgi:1-acyl-sn-glycerol-3-phosphate acyltransferase
MRLMNSGVNIIVFPEGTTTDGSGVRDFKTSLFKLPLDLKRPVLPVSIMYSHIDSVPITPNMRDRIAWYGDMELLPHLWNLLGMKNVGCSVRYGSMIDGVTTEGTSAGRKMLAASAREAVLDGLEEMRLEAATAQAFHKPV